MGKNKTGRPSKYHTHIKPNMELIKKWREDGETEETILKTLNVAQSTWCTYKHKFPEFAEALKNSSEFILAKTQDSMYQSAWGRRELNFKEIWDLRKIWKNGKLIEEFVLVKKEIYPDKVIEGKVTAQIAILKKQDLEWREALNNTMQLKLDTEDERITIINDAPGDNND